jgi:hypothetical protein
MCHLTVKFLRQVGDDEGVEWALDDADATTDAQRLRDQWFTTRVVEDYAFDAVAHRRAECPALGVALLGLATIFQKNCYPHAASPVANRSILLLCGLPEAAASSQSARKR